MCLRHGRFCSVDNIVYKHPSEGKLNVSAIDIFCLLVIGVVKMVAAVVTGNVNIFPDLNESLGSQNGQSAIAPGFQSIGGKPIHSDITLSTIAFQHHISEVFKIRFFRMIDIPNL